MDYLQEIGAHCADCAAGLRAAAEMLEDHAIGPALRLRAELWEQAADSLAHLAGQAKSHPSQTESVRASLYRTLARLNGAVQDVAAILDDCAWWETLTRTQCATFLQKAAPRMQAALTQATAEATARSAYDDMRHRAQSTI